MPIKVQWDNSELTAICDTPQEAAEILSGFRSKSSPRKDRMEQYINLAQQFANAGGIKALALIAGFTLAWMLGGKAGAEAARRKSASNRSWLPSDKWERWD